MSQKKNNIIDEANNIVPKLRNDNNNIDAPYNDDPFYMLKTTLFSFFENVLSKVQTEDDLERRTRVAIMEQIDAGEVNFSQLLSLLTTITNEKHNLADSILSVFKPTPGTGEVSPLINPKNKDDYNDEVAFKNLSSQERDNLDKLTRLLSAASSLDDQDENSENETKSDENS